jgi:hypothetical protein
LVVTGTSFILIIVLPLSLMVSGFSFEPVISAVLFTLLIVYVGGTIAVITYSESGWRVEGSTLEWILAAMFAPALVLVLYLISKDQRGIDVIDLNDRERLERL